MILHQISQINYQKSSISNNSKFRTFGRKFSRVYLHRENFLVKEFGTPKITVLLPHFKCSEKLSYHRV